MSDLEEFEAMNKAYVESLHGLLGDEPLPARTSFQAGKLLFGARYYIFCDFRLQMCDLIFIFWRSL